MCCRPETFCALCGCPNYPILAMLKPFLFVVCMLTVLHEGKRFLEKPSFQVKAWSIKGQKQDSDEETQEHNPTIEWWNPPSWPPLLYTCIPSLLCCVQSELRMQMHCIGGARGRHHHSIVGLWFWVFSSLPCFCPFYRSSPDLNWSFIRNIFLFLPVKDCTGEDGISVMYNTFN